MKWKIKLAFAYVAGFAVGLLIYPFLVTAFILRRTWNEIVGISGVGARMIMLVQAAARGRIENPAVPIDGVGEVEILDDEKTGAD